MKPKQLLKANSAGWIVIILAILLLYFSYFLFYIPHQESLVEQRGFRILEEYASNVLGKYNYYEQHLNNYSPLYTLGFLSSSKQAGELGEKAQTTIREQDVLRKMINDKEASIITEVYHADPNLVPKLFYDSLNNNFFLNFNSGVDTLISNLLDFDTLIECTDMLWCQYPREPDSKSEKQKEGRGLSIAISKTDDGLSSKLGEWEVEINPAQTNGESFTPDANANDQAISFIHKVPFSTLLNGLKFDNLLNNIVMFNDSLLIYNSNGEVVNDITNPGALVDSVAKHQGGIIEKIKVRGEENYVMIMPVDFLGNKFYFAGFISGLEYRKKTRAINTQFLIIISSILFLVLIGMPVLKIIFVSKQERLHARDATSATVSMILGVGLFILITISILKHYVVDRDVLESRLKRISKTLYSNFDGDLLRVIDLYKGIAFNNNTKSTPLDSLTKSVFVSDSIRFKIVNEQVLKSDFPLNEILLIDSVGKLKKAVTRTHFFERIPVDLSSRLYFQNISDSAQSWILNSRSSGSSGQKFYIESVKSYNTGYGEAAISFRLPQKDSIFGGRCLAITSHLPSLFDQVLPTDVEFVIINDLGEVLFHSNQEKNLHENFLDECEENVRISGAMKHRIIDLVEIEYNEKSWLVRIIPVEDTPLFHLTLVDLGQTQNKNARIMFFTLYFLLATFICILIGLQLLKTGKPGYKAQMTKMWSLSWLFFHHDRFLAYKILIFIQSVLLFCQFLGVYINGKPLTMFVYQMIFIAFSGFVALTILGEQKDPFRNFFHKSNFKSTLIFVIVIILNIFLFRLGCRLALLPILVVIIISLLIHYYFDLSSAKPSKPWNFVKQILLLPYTISIGIMLKTGVEQKDSKNTQFSARNVFFIYMFLWLIGISTVPVLQYYHAVKVQEEKLWQSNNMEDMARKNLELRARHSDRSGDWYKGISGSKLDKLILQDSVYKVDTHRNNELELADRFYARMSDPATKGDHLMGLLHLESQHDEWFRDSERICFFRAGGQEYLMVSSSGYDVLKVGDWLLYFTIPILLALFFVWLLYRYVGGIILNMSHVTWSIPKIPAWKATLEKNQLKRIMLISFSGSSYLDESRKILAHQPDGSSNVENEKTRLRLVSGQELAKKNFDLKTLIAGPQDLIWIRGLELYFQDVEKFEQIAPSLLKINRKAKGKVIIELPFGIDFIDECLENCQSDNEMTLAEKERILSMKRSISILLGDFYRYTGDQGLVGKLTQSPESIVNDQFGQELYYNFIWNHLTNMEKLVINDLADDGMLNLKNTTLINRLKLKGLIVFKPYPKLFCDSFHYFLVNSVNPAETLSIEQNLSKQGKWRNMRYLILLILIPMAGFVFIAQGSSVEKVIGIFSGALALFSGLFRLFDTNAFRQPSS